MRSGGGRERDPALACCRSMEPAPRVHSIRQASAAGAPLGWGRRAVKRTWIPDFARMTEQAFYATVSQSIGGFLEAELGTNFQ
jgi:hypothetical protein